MPLCVAADLSIEISEISQSRGDSTTELDWELAWAPYDETTYQQVLQAVRPADVVLEIGAGDLRLARRLAEQARRVYALELQAHLVAAATRTPLPANLTVLVGDARELPFPGDVTVGVLLMRHCRHWALYADKLRAVGCTRLLTNARWRLDVERVDLSAPCLPFEQVTMGWYACRCGAVGFVPGPPEAWTPELETTVYEVAACPQCQRGGSEQGP